MLKNATTKQSGCAFITNSIVPPPPTKDVGAINKTNLLSRPHFALILDPEKLLI